MLPVSVCTIKVRGLVQMPILDEENFLRAAAWNQLGNSGMFYHGLYVVGPVMTPYISHYTANWAHALCTLL